jgi:sulfur carrier protein ThiS
MPQAMIVDPVRLQKGIGELRRATGSDVLVTAAPSGMEAEALGAALDMDTWPPRIVAAARPGFSEIDDFDALWVRSPSLVASLEATSRLAPETGDAVVIVAGLSGPATLLAQLTGSRSDVTDDERDFVSRALAALVRRFGQAGAGFVVMVESEPLPDAWAEMFGTIGNTAKFLKLPVVVALEAQPAPTDWPRAALRLDGSAGSSGSALVLDRDPSHWPVAAAPSAECRVMTTAGEIPADFPLGGLIDQMRLINAQGGAP